MVPLIGSFYPVPPFPVDIFPYIFLAYVLAGSGWLFAVSRRNRQIFAEIEMDLEGSMLSTRTRTLRRSNAWPPGRRHRAGNGARCRPAGAEVAVGAPAG